VIQYQPPAPAAPVVIRPVDIGEVVQLEIATAQSLTLEERNRKWAERRRRAEAAPKPVGL